MEVTEPEAKVAKLISASKFKKWMTLSYWPCLLPLPMKTVRNIFCPASCPGDYKMQSIWFLWKFVYILICAEWSLLVIDNCMQCDWHMSYEAAMWWAGRYIVHCWGAAPLKRQERLCWRLTIEIRGWADSDPTALQSISTNTLVWGEQLSLLPRQWSCFAVAQLDISIQTRVLPRVLCIHLNTWHLFPWKEWV